MCVNMTLYLPWFSFYILATVFFFAGTFRPLSVYPNNEMNHFILLFLSQFFKTFCLALLVSPLCYLGRTEPELYPIVLHLP